jgi:hypothetical protein
VALSNAGRAMQKDLKSLQFVTRDESGAGQIAQNEEVPADARPRVQARASPARPPAPPPRSAMQAASSAACCTLQQGDMADHVSAPAPLLTKPMFPTEQMASALKDAIAYSGVFYESMSPHGPPASARRRADEGAASPGGRPAAATSTC